MAKYSLFLCFAGIAMLVFVKSTESKKSEDIGFYELRRGIVSAKFTNLGATIVSLNLPDKYGNLADVVLGYDTIQQYKNNTKHFGATVGRVANRIGGAHFILNGTSYKLIANDGNNTIHGGPKGYSNVVWIVKKYQNEGDSPYITFSYHSSDDEERFPGALEVDTTFTLVKEGMTVTMKAKALNKATPVNLAQHAYWNLGGHDSGDILSNEIQIFASRFTPVDSTLIPTGEITSVKGTPFDFLKPATIKEKIKNLPNGYDINYAVDGDQKELNKVATVFDKKSGRVMELLADQPGQLKLNCRWSDRLRTNSCVYICCSSSAAAAMAGEKAVWVWTENKQAMTAALECGWSTFLFSNQSRDLARHWSSMALIYPLFIENGELLDSEQKRVATYSEISSPEQLQKLQQQDEQADMVIVNLLDWQVIPAENIVAAFQNSQKTVFAVSRTPIEAQVFFEALELGLGGVVLKSEDVKAVLELKEYFDRRNEANNKLELTKATVTQVKIVGMGDRVCVDLCSLMKPGEGLLVGSFARGLFLVHSECLESNYISSRPFRVNAGPVHAYVAVPGGKTSYLSELKAGEEVIVVDQNGRQRTAVVGRVKIETRQLILVEAKIDSDIGTSYSILLQNAETVALICSRKGNGLPRTAIPVTSLNVGDEVMVRLQGGARHTGIEIQEFIVEK